MFKISADKAPEKGFLLAYYPRVLVFEPYEIRDGEVFFDGCEAFRDQEPKECHLFDRETEYRLIRRESRGDRIETVLRKKDEESMDPDLLYTEVMPVKEEYRKKGTLPEKLSVTTRYEYSENDVLAMKNYRIGF